MNGLLLHTGAKSITPEALAAIPTPEPTDTHYPIAHSRLLAITRDTLATHGATVTGEAHGITKSGSRYFGLLEIRGTERDWGLVVGIRNSHDKSLPAGLVCGAQVFVCDNLSFSGEVRIGRKHTRYIDDSLPALIAGAVAKLVDLREGQAKRFDAYRAAPLGHPAAMHLIGSAYRHGVLPAPRVGPTIDEWYTPRHKEFAEGHNVWRLFNAFTESLKGSLTALPARTQAIHGMLDEQCGLI